VRPGPAQQTARLPAQVPPDLLPAVLLNVPPPERCAPTEVLSGWDFEGGARVDDSWYTEGTAFLGQPAFGENISARRFSPTAALGRLGGDYWDGARAVGIEGQWWVGSAEVRHTADAPWGRWEEQLEPGQRVRTGTATAIPFTLASQYIHLLVGGVADANKTAVELWTEASGVDETAERTARLLGQRVEPGMVFQGRRFLRRQTVTPTAGEMLQPAVFDVRGALYQGAVATLRLVDVSDAGHLNVDAIRCLDTAASPYPPRPLWGFADTHTHPMMHQGFGGLQGIASVWGVPGGDVRTYAGPSGQAAYARDVPTCDGRGHGGGNASALMIKGIEMRLDPDSLIATLAGPLVAGAVAGVAVGLGVYIWAVVGVTFLLLAAAWPVLLALVASIAVAGVIGAAHVTSVLDHMSQGPPAYLEAPTFYAGAHQQQHITGFRRAFDGGLRVTSALAVTSRTMEFMMGHLHNDTIYDGFATARVALTPTRELLEAHVCGMKQLAAMNADWMELAYSPEDIRRIVGQDKLAVVLGVEVPDLGELFGTPITNAAGAEAEVAWLHGLGIRHVLPIHARNNPIGGAGVFQDAYNGDNDLFHRAPFGDASAQWLTLVDEQYPPRFLDVVEGGCDTGGALATRGNCVLYSLDYEQKRLGLAFLAGFIPVANAPWYSGSKVPSYRFGVDDQGQPANGTRGHMNALGIEPQTGVPYIRALMNHGMLLDLAHMSDRAAAQTVGLMRSLSPACAASAIVDSSDLDAVRVGSSQACLDGTYPALVSHVNFRAQSIHQDARQRFENGGPSVLSPVPNGLPVDARTATGIKDWLPSEWELSDPLVDMLAATGGLVSPFVNQDPIEPPPWQTLPPGLDNNCMRSSQEFGLAMDYAATRMGGRGVGLATDLGLHPLTAPRFGPDACWISNFDRVKNPERARQPGRYRPSLQANAVRYGEGNNAQPQTEPVRADQPLLQPFEMPRKYNFNIDGMAQYGLVVDQLQDARNVGMPQNAFNALFRSAEDYVAMWERAWRVTGCAAGDVRCAGNLDTTPDPAGQMCQAACKGTCPADTTGGFVYSPPDAGMAGSELPPDAVRVDGGFIVPVDHFVPVCPPARACLGTNLLRNAGFETATEVSTGPGQLPDHWFAPVGTPDTISADGTFGLAGTDFAAFTGNGARFGNHWLAAWSFEGEQVGQRLAATLIPGHRYLLSGWFLQADRADIASAGGYDVTLTDTSSPNLQPFPVGSFCPVGFGTWQLRSLEFTAPADAEVRLDLVFQPLAMFQGSYVYPGMDELWLVDLMECP